MLRSSDENGIQIDRESLQINLQHPMETPTLDTLYSSGWWLSPLASYPWPVKWGRFRKAPVRIINPRPVSGGGKNK